MLMVMEKSDNMPSFENSKGLMSTGICWLWISVVFFALDQYTKQIAVEYFVREGGRVEVMPFFNFTLAYNRGAAFSFLANQGGWQVFFFATISTVVSIGLLYWLYTLSSKNRWLSIALCLILSGAMGNLYDRVTLGYVVDFIDWYYDGYHFPAFNIADSVIFLGAAMMLYDSFMHPEKSQQNLDEEKSK
jgi:signal peptidase II